MYARMEKPKENKSRAVANSVNQKKSVGKSTFQLVDNRPEAVAQRKPQESANNSPQVKQLRVFQEMANNSFHKSIDEEKSLEITTIQRKVAVARTDKEEENDWVILTNLQFAKELVGGNVVDFGAESDFSDMTEGENLAIVGHGIAGSIQGFDAEAITAALTKDGKEMPTNTRKLILLSCNAAAPTESQDPKSSLVSKLAFLLREAGYGTIVEGKPSLTQVSPATGINATIPTERGKHLGIEKALINKHELNFTTPPLALRPERIEWFKSIKGVKLGRLTEPSYIKFLSSWLAKNNIRKFASEILAEQGYDPDSMSLNEKSSLIAKITGPFYTELVKETRKAGTLFESGVSSGSGTLLALGSEVLEL
jgi:hypothetical protein